MLDRLLPQSADNTYRGFRLALWLFAVLVLMKLAMSVNSIFNGRSVASGADGIPLDSYTPAGAQAVVSLFAIWGLGHLTLCVMCVVVLVRYRALIPFMFALLLLEHLSRRLVGYYLPIARTGSPPAPILNLVLFALEIAGLALSLRGRPGPAAPA